MGGVRCVGEFKLGLGGDSYLHEAGAGKASVDIDAGRLCLHTTGTEPSVVTPPLLINLLPKPLVR